MSSSVTALWLGRRRKFVRYDEAGAVPSSPVFEPRDQHETSATAQPSSNWSPRESSATEQPRLEALRGYRLSARSLAVKIAGLHVAVGFQ